HRRRAKRRAPPPGGSTVTFTVVIPAHNEERVIAKTLAALDLARGREVEVIVVDDGSIDLTAEIAGSFPVRVLRQARSGKAAALDVGGYPRDTLVEDADVTVALLRGRWRIHYEPTAVAWTEAPEGVADALRQRRRWAYGNVEVLAKHAGSMLHPGEGRVGLLGLPWMLLSQVLLPVGGPLADAFLLYLIVVGNLTTAGAVLLLTLLAEIVLIE